MSIKPLFTERPEYPYRLFEAYQIDPAFRMIYPLTREYLLLAEHLAGRIRQYVLPFFEQYSTAEKILARYTRLLHHYKIPYDGSVPRNGAAEQLIYECAFRGRNRDIFARFHAQAVQQAQRYLETIKNHPEYEPNALDALEKLRRRKQIFEDDASFRQEAERMDGRVAAFLRSLEKKK